MRKREGITVLKRISVFLCHFKHRFGSILLLLVVICFCNTTHYNAKETIDNMSTNRQTDGHRQSRFLILSISTHCFGHLMRTGIY